MTNDDNIELSVPVAMTAILAAFNNLPLIYHMKRYDELGISMNGIQLFGHKFDFYAECVISISGGYRLVSAATNDQPEAVDDTHEISDLKWSYMTLSLVGKDNILPENIHSKFTREEYRLIESAVQRSLIIEE